jgi:DNA-directed RNA polymerase specialized sigma24 family protein
MRDHDRTDMGGSRDEFLTTQWSLIDDIKAGEDKERALIGLLLERYWKPVYCYLRRKGYDNEQAKDLTQDFFHEVVLNRNLVGRADQDKGRFRFFLLHALNQYLINQQRDARAQKRIPREKLVSLDMADLPASPQDIADSAPEDSYHYAWLSSLLERVICELRSRYCEQGMETHWALFDEHVLSPILGSGSPPSLTEICRRHGIEDTKKASNIIVTVKRAFRSALTDYVRSTVISEDCTNEELGDLLRFFPGEAQHWE